MYQRVFQQEKRVVLHYEMFNQDTFVLLFLAVGYASTDVRPKVILATSTANFDIPLSSIAFSEIDVYGDPFDIVAEINKSLKKIGFPLGLAMHYSVMGQARACY